LSATKSKSQIPSAGGSIQNRGDNRGDDHPDVGALPAAITSIFFPFSENPNAKAETTSGILFTKTPLIDGRNVSISSAAKRTLFRKFCLCAYRCAQGCTLGAFFVRNPTHARRNFIDNNVHVGGFCNPIAKQSDIGYQCNISPRRGAEQRAVVDVSSAHTVRSVNEASVCRSMRPARCEHRRVKRGAGQALLVTFAAIGKTDWPRAAIERDAGERASRFEQTQRPSSWQTADLRFAWFHALYPRLRRG